MVITILVTLIQILIWIVIVDVVLSYFMDPYHPVRQALDGIVGPLLAPIRGIMPFMGGIDFSPLILILLLQLLANLLIRSF
jgi:YggT family protein